MARLETTADIQESGWSFTVVADRDESLFLTEEWLKHERKDANLRMRGAQRLAKNEVRRTLGRRLSRPSRPNEPPRAITRALMRSARIGRRRWNEDKTVLTGRMEFRHPAAGPLEFGAVRSLGFGPRPWWRPTLIRIADRLEAILVGDE